MTAQKPEIDPPDGPPPSDLEVIELSEEQLRALDEAFPPGVTAGDRYADMAAVEL